MTDVTVRNDPDRSSYVATLDGAEVGRAEYRIGDGVITFTHTEVADDVEGRGVGSTLARAALDDVGARGGFRVVARCPFIAEWIERHPEYGDLVGRR